MHACMHTLICRLFQNVCCREQGVVDTCMCWTSAISIPEAALYFGTVERRACENRKLLTPLWPCAGVGKPFFTFGTEPPALPAAVLVPGALPQAVAAAGGGHAEHARQGRHGRLPGLPGKYPAAPLCSCLYMLKPFGYQRGLALAHTQLCVSTTRSGLQHPRT